MVLETQLYFEAHVTIEPVFDDPCEVCQGCGVVPPGRECTVCNGEGKLTSSDLGAVKQIAKSHGFKVADLLMQKRKADTQERSKDDTFCTARSKSYEDIHGRTVGLIVDLKSAGFKVWRYKIEDTVLDSKYSDVLGLLDG